MELNEIINEKWETNEFIYMCEFFYPQRMPGEFIHPEYFPNGGLEIVGPPNSGKSYVFGKGDIFERMSVSVCIAWAYCTYCEENTIFH